MAEIAGLVGSIIFMIELTDKIANTVHRYVHTQRSVRAVLYPLTTRMIAYKGLFQELHDQARDDQTDGIRLLALQHANGPLWACQEALEILLRKLEKPKRLPKLEVGMRLPKRASSAMKLLDDLLPIFELALHADQRTISLAIQERLRSTSQSLEELQIQSAKIDEHILAHHEDAKRWKSSQDFTKQKLLNEKRRKMILNWLSNIDSVEKHEAARELWQEGTGLWFLQSVEFSNWQSGKNPHIWLHGIPGSGKTILASTVISNLSQNFAESIRSRRCAVIYFYFDFGKPTKGNCNTMIRSLLAQLARHFDDIPVSVQTLFSKHVGNDIKVPSEPRRRVLITVLLNLLDLLPEVYIIIDALDECTRGEDRELLNTIGELISAGKSSLRILCTSRKTGLIELRFVELAIQAVELNAGKSIVLQFYRSNCSSNELVDFY